MSTLGIPDTINLGSFSEFSNSEEEVFILINNNYNKDELNWAIAGRDIKKLNNQIAVDDAFIDFFFYFEDISSSSQNYHFYTFFFDFS